MAAKRKGVVIALSSGYEAKAKSLAKEWGLDYDDRPIKAQAKIKEANGKYKKVVAIGAQWVLNGVMYSGDAMKAVFAKKNPVKIETTNINNKEYLTGAEFEHATK